MEHKEIVTMVLAIALVIIVIGVLGMISRAAGNEDSVADPATTSELPPITRETDIWDVIHEQQAAITATAATDSEQETVTDAVIVTDEEGNPVTDEEGNPVTESVVVTDEDGNPVTVKPVETDEEGNPITSEAETETVTDSGMTADPYAPARTEININPW